MVIERLGLPSYTLHNLFLKFLWYTLSYTLDPLYIPLIQWWILGEASEVEAVGAGPPFDLSLYSKSNRIKVYIIKFNR